MALIQRKEESYPSGFRFAPSDMELVVEFLINGKWQQPLICNSIQNVEFYEFAPLDLKQRYSMQRVPECYFIATLKKRCRGGMLPSRITPGGYWKMNGSDVTVKDKDGKKVGFRKSLAYFRGVQPDGEKTNWAAHEFRLDKDGEARARASPAYISDPLSLEGLVLYKLFKRSKSQSNGGEDDGEERDKDDNSELQSLANLEILPPSYDVNQSTPSMLDNCQAPSDGGNYKQLEIPQIALDPELPLKKARNGK